jgi:transglutaminase-like putative cysteine protease
MGFATYFRAFSYAMIGVAMISLLVAGGLSATLALVFLVVMVVSWRLETTRWQVPEKIGLIIVLLSIPLFYVDWRYQQSIGEPLERLGVTALAHLIVFLSAVKLLQVKKDRDWVFLYLISFFEVLLAAGLSFSPIFLVTLSLYLLSALSAVTAFEIQKARRAVKLSETRLLVPPDSRVFKGKRNRVTRSSEAIRLPFVAVGLLVLIFILAIPLFLVAPRSGAASLTRSSGGLSNFIGFSENVTLGQIGELKRDDRLVMRVRVEDSQSPKDLRWRGVALDEFTGRSWKKSIDSHNTDKRVSDRSGGGFFQFDTTEALHRLTTQTFFLEPIESPVLFAAPRPVAIQGDLPFVRVDGEGSIQTRRHEFERILYKAISDTEEPRVDLLRADLRPYAPAIYRYLQLPAGLDPRIGKLATRIINEADARDRYDAARAIEAALQKEYTYSLLMKAGGDDPLADFLFNVKAGHCEYFSTAMAIMLRTHGIASRVVNGFLPGEYNEASGAFTVRQSDAHSWVEVYFPETKSWVTFDPTPPAGRAEPIRTGITAQLQKYAEAMELLWFQYIVGYDKQEQRTLAISLTSRVNNYGRIVTSMLNSARNYIPSNALELTVFSLGLLLFGTLMVLGYRVFRLGWRRALRLSEDDERPRAGVAFYERLTKVMEERGVARDKAETPMEFASSLRSTDALVITRAYNRVRFGNQKLSSHEMREVERALTELESTEN